MAFKNPWQDDNDPWKKGGREDPTVDFFKNIHKKLSAFFSPKSKNPGQSPKSGFVYTILICAAGLYLSSGIYRIEPDERGVVLRFGKWTRTVGAGLHYALPYPFEAVLSPKVTRINCSDIAPSGEKDLALTNDLNLVNIAFKVWWKVKESKVEDYLFCDRHPTQTIKHIAESVMREIVGQTPFAYLQTEGRAEIQEKAKAQLQAALDEYKMGIDVVRISLRQVEPPASVIDSFRDVERAQAEQQSERNKADAYARDVKARTNGLIAEKLNRGEAQKQTIIAEAEGVAARFLAIYEQYKLCPDIVSSKLYISTCKEVLSKVKKVIVDENVKIMPYMPIANDIKNVKVAEAGQEGGVQ